MKNWEKVKLGTLLTESKIVSDKPNTKKRIRVKLSIQGVEKRPDTKDKSGATKYYKRKAGQFVYGRQNLHKGAFGIIPNELDSFESSADIPAFDVDESCYPEWIFYFFKKGNFYLKLENLAKGIGSKRINPEQIYELDIYLPSKEEQRKILFEIEKLDYNSQNLFQEIEFQKKSLKKLQRSILVDAIQGNLTKEWREQNKSTEPASMFLKKIEVKKELLIKEKKIKVDNSSDSIITKNCDWEINPLWDIAKLYDIFSFIDYRGKTPAKSTEGKRLITAKNIRFGYIQNEPVEYVTPEFYEKYMVRGLPKKGDILFVTEGYTIGFAALMDLPFDCALAQRTICFQPYLEDMETDFFYYLILSTQFQNIIFDNQTGSAVKGIKSSKLKKIPIPIPPKAEQKEIVKKVKKLMLGCSELEKEIILRKEDADKLVHSVLIELLGDENNIISSKNPKRQTETISREIIYNSKTINMKLVELLKTNGKLHAEDLWKMSEHYIQGNESESIDKFYAELKNQIEIEKTIKESSDKGYLELL